jgi:UDP-N-acetylglucosamine--N-acetylmuramyl-(pentapeptide) pyrophosphoryl-undecaprenol N-acetylglucosamine transferase
MKKIIFTGGGTGGHIMPNLAIMQNLKGKYQIEYIGGKNGMERDIVANKYPFFGITTCKLKRSLSASNLLIPFKLLKGYYEAKKILKTQKPNLVFSKGGYVAVPVVFACKALKIPVVCHESDYSMGLANKLTAKKCKIVCTSFADTANSIKNGVYTGSPVRDDIFNGKADNAKKCLFLKPNLPSLLVVGGSLGSQTINSIMLKNAKQITQKFNVIHIAGKNNDIKCEISNYNILPYVQNIQDYYALSNFVVTRGGSNVLFELLALKKPMIIIPLEKGSRGDQVLNAKIFVREGIALSATESELLEQDTLILKKLEQLERQKTNLVKNMEHKNLVGNQKIIQQIEKFLT